MLKLLIIIYLKILSHYDYLHILVKYLNAIVWHNSNLITSIYVVHHINLYPKYNLLYN